MDAPHMVLVKKPWGDMGNAWVVGATRGTSSVVKVIAIDTSFRLKRRWDSIMTLDLHCEELGLIHDRPWGEIKKGSAGPIKKNHVSLEKMISGVVKPGWGVYL